MRQKVLETLGYIINGSSIALFFYLSTVLEVPDRPVSVIILAWLLFTLGVVLVVLSTLTLMRNRDAGLIENGIFGIVRHPMYLGAMLLFLSWVFFLPHWITVLIAAVNLPIVYAYMPYGENFNLEKFGEAYAGYMQRVPRINLLAGLVRALRRE
ncbi:MAG: isoprenylcysteine carboxylmethyltransferase family protein [Anaerolineales bacterium]|jgi:protein-S-isoprenylcysteine O-methyltransferase Ste14